MQITRLPNESTADFVARAFRINRSVNNETMATPIGIRWVDENGRTLSPRQVQVFMENNESIPGPPRVFIQASPVSFKSLQPSSTATWVSNDKQISRRRAIWYGSGLVFGVACIAMAVFGMGQ